LNTIFRLFKYFIFKLNYYFLNDIHYKNKNCSILFINTGQIGDLVVSSLILENDGLLNYDNIYILILDRYKELYKNYNGKIKIITFNLIKYRYFFPYRVVLLRKLRKLNLKYAYNLTAARGFVNDEITLLSGASLKYALSSDLKYLGNYYGTKLNNFYTHIIRYNTNNEYEKTINLISDLSHLISTNILIQNSKTFKISKDKNIIKKNIVIAPFSSNKTKDWPFDNYKYIIEELSKYSNIILVGSRKQKEGLYKLQNNLNNVSVNYSSLGDVTEIISKCSLFIGNDSGLTHIAYRLSNPIIVLLGGGCYEKFFPFTKINKNSLFVYHWLDCFNCNWNCIYRNSLCLSELKKEDILTKSLEILKTT